MSGFVWLASYPKSGNTWVRAFLSSVLQGGGPVDINRLTAAMQPSRRDGLDDLFGIETSDLLPAEILDARPAALAASDAMHSDAVLCKVHEAWVRTSTGLPLFPAAVTKASVYIVRDPRDVAVSFAHHWQMPIDHVIDLMADPAAALSGVSSCFTANTVQPLLTWSGHVESWLDLAAPSPLLLRYEELLAAPVAQGRRVARHLGQLAADDVYEAAARHTDFATLRCQEDEHGFAESRVVEQRFFRSGKAGAWRTALSPSQTARIEREQGTVMTRLGYLR